MPTSAVTGTKQLHTTTKEPTVVGDDKVKARKPRAKPAETVGEPLADPCGNGTIQVVTADGSIVNIDAAQPGWEDKIRALDPKHPVLKYR